MNIITDIWKANQGAIVVLGAWCILTLVLWAWESWKERENDPDQLPR